MGSIRSGRRAYSTLKPVEELPRVFVSDAQQFGLEVVCGQCLKGKQRLWLLCPLCGNPRAWLLVGHRGFACRVCFNGATYRSQRMTPTQRISRRYRRTVERARAVKRRDTRTISRIVEDAERDRDAAFKADQRELARLGLDGSFMREHYEKLQRFQQKEEMRERRKLATMLQKKGVVLPDDFCTRGLKAQSAP